MLDQLSKKQDLFILSLVLIGAIVIFIYSLKQNQSRFKVVNQPSDEIYQVQIKPEVLFSHQSQLQISLVRSSNRQ